MQKLPIGLWVQDAINYLVDLSEYHLRMFSDSLNFIIGIVVDSLEWINPFLLIIILLIITYIIKRNWKTLLLISIGCLIILNLGYWRESL